MRKIRIISYLTFAITSTTLFAATPAVQITFLSAPQNIAQILKMQSKITMSKRPKELSAHPRATCFAANIDQFLPSDIKAVIPTYGCVFSDQVAMNAALLRAGLYVHTDAGMASDAQLFSSKLMTTVGGHDFAGAELNKYSKTAVIPADSVEEHKIYKEIEKEFNAQVIQPIIDRHNNDFIFFAVINTPKFKENLSHELLHAQYYNSPQIAKILEHVWQNVAKKDQDNIISCLRNGGYDMQQHALLLREFYSYFMQYNATQYLQGIKVLKPMAPLAKVYAPKISAALAKDGIKVLTVTGK